jgi:hypothetical protein
LNQPRRGHVKQIDAPRTMGAAAEGVEQLLQHRGRGLQEPVEPQRLSGSTCTDLAIGFYTTACSQKNSAIYSHVNTK